MDYRKYGDTLYIRMDKGDEIISGIFEVCKKENIKSAIFNGIGGCSKADIQTFIPETGSFELQHIEGMLELVSLTGNVICDDDGEIHQHTHAAFAYKHNNEHLMSAGHIKSITVLYTAEIELRPVKDGIIGRKLSTETGTGFWDFK